MALKIIVSYDDTDNDRDALALGRLLAYLRRRALARLRPPLLRAGRSRRSRPRSCWPAAPPRSALRTCPATSSSMPATSVGLTELAERESADVIVFGSEYRTAPGTVKPGIPAHKLLLGGPAAIAVAPAGLRSHPVGERQHDRRHRRGRREPPGRPPNSLAAALGATSVESGAGPVDLLVVGSRPESPRGQGHPQRLQRLRGRGRDLPGAGRRRAASRSASRRRQAPVASTTRMTAAISGSRPSSRFLRLAPAGSPGRRARRPRPPRRPPAESRFDHEGVGNAGRRRLGQDPRVTFSDARSAFDQPWPKERSWPSPAAGPRGSSGCSRAVPTPGRPARSRRPSSHGSTTVASSSSSVEVEDAGVVKAAR